MTSNMLKSINEFEWDFSIKIKKVKIITNDKVKEKHIANRISCIKQNRENFKRNLLEIKNICKGKKIIFIHNICPNTFNDEKGYPKILLDKRKNYIEFIKNQIVSFNDKDVHFFNHICDINDVSNKNHLSEEGNKKFRDKFDLFLRSL